MQLKKVKLLLFLSVLLIIFIGIFAIFLNDEQTSFSFSHTKALCEGNTCADYLIECDRNGEVIETSRISGFVVFGNDWKDPRTEEEINKMC